MDFPIVVSPLSDNREMHTLFSPGARHLSARLAAAALVAALSSPAWSQSPVPASASDANAPSIGPDGAWPALMTTTPIFDEILAQQLPPGFKPQAERTTAGGQLYMRSMVIASDPVDGPWTQRFLVIGAKRQANSPETTAKDFALQVAASFQAACPTTFKMGRMLEGRIRTGHEAYVLVVGCGRHTLTNDKQPVSEITVVAAFKGDRNMYTLQRSLRAPPMDVAPEPDRAMLQQWLSEMSPTGICPKQPDEPAPYASCVKRTSK